MFGFGGLKFNVVVGGLLVIRFIQRSCIGMRFLGRFNVVVKNMDVIFFMFEEIIYLQNLYDVV